MELPTTPRDTLIEQLRAVPGLVLVESDLTKEKDAFTEIPVEVAWRG